MRRPLPNYFLADLPAGPVVSAAVVTDACQTLKRNREKYLLPKTTPVMIHMLSELGEQWMDPGYEFRQRALEDGPAMTGYSAMVLRAGLDGFFGQLTAENLQSIILQDLGAPQRLDAFSQTSQETQERRTSWCRGPELLGHVAAGTLPNPILMSLVLGLLARSAQFVKCASGAAFLPRLFAHSLYELEPKIASCLEVAEWAGGSRELEDALLRQVDCLTVTGSDAAVQDLRLRMPATVRCLAYGHRVSWGFVTAEALSGRAGKKLAARAAADVAAWDQQGCLSPQVLYVQVRGMISPEGFAESLAEEMAALDIGLPRAPLPVEEATSIQIRRSFYEVRAAAETHETRVWCSPGSTAWTVVYDNDPLFQGSNLNRFIQVKAVQDLEEVLRHSEAVRGRVSTVALAAAPEQMGPLAMRLAQWGVTRICPLGKMQRPPFTWRHDGRPALGDLVLWTDWEQ